MNRSLAVAGAILSAVIVASCDGDAPGRPSAPDETTVESGGRGGVRATTNGAPTLVLKTTPREVDGIVHAQSLVKFNLCGSVDPDKEDSLNWQFHFGDSGRPAFNEDGSFNADFGHFCRAEHTYAAGTYTATLSVTDKNLSDQGAGVSAQARTTRTVKIIATGGPEPPAALVSGSLTTSYTPTNKCGGLGAGPVFDVTASKDTVITAFDMNLDGAGTHTFSLYTTPGTWTGKHATPGAWTLVGTTSVVAQGAGNPTHVPLGTVKVSAGQSVGIYLYSADPVSRVRSGSATYSNAQIQVGNGAIVCTGLFGTLFSPWEFSGTVYYQYTP